MLVETLSQKNCQAITGRCRGTRATVLVQQARLWLQR